MKVSVILLVLMMSVTGFVRGDGEERFFEVRARRFNYTPHIIKVNKGDKVIIRLISEDVTHGLFVDGYGVNTSARPGEDGSLTFVADKTGKFAFRCSVTCGELHPYMIGYLKVGPNIRYYFFIAASLGLALISLITNMIAKRKESGNAEAQG